MCVDRARGDPDRHAPDVGQQVVPREHPARMTDERPQQAKLERRERQLLLAEPRAVPRVVDAEAPAADPVAGRPRRLAAAQHGAHPQDQLAHAEWFGDVVVGPDLEADHAVDLVGAGADHHHRQIAGRRIPADRLAHVDPRGVGQRQVEQHQVRRLREDAGQRRRPAVARAGPKALAGERVVDRRREVAFILDDQDRRRHTRCRGYTRPGEFRPAEALCGVRENSTRM